jgi:hypothetical protein
MEKGSMPKRTAAVETTTDYQAIIAEAAYFKAEQRGFAPGYEIADWLEAEREFEGGSAAKSGKAGKRTKATAGSKRMNGKK